MAIRSERESLFRLGLRSNLPMTVVVGCTAALQLALVSVPVLVPVFDTVVLTPVQLGVVCAVSTFAFIAVEVEKWLGRRRSAIRPQPARPEAVGGRA
jgi:Ca2+-transporting ATPase